MFSLVYFYTLFHRTPPGRAYFSETVLPFINGQINKLDKKQNQCKIFLYITLSFCIYYHIFV